MTAYGKTAVVDYVGTFDDGEVFDSTNGIEPLEFEVGSGKVIHGFDEAVACMEVGQTKRISISPKDAYGEYDESKIERGPMYAIPGAKDIEIGKRFFFVTQEGLRLPAVVTSIDQGIATIDFNHPLAGKILNFEITLLEER